MNTSTAVATGIEMKNTRENGKVNTDFQGNRGSSPRKPVGNSRQTTIPKKRQELLKKAGWGYNDWYLAIDGETRGIKITSNRYPDTQVNATDEYCEWLKGSLGIDLRDPDKQYKFEPNHTEKSFPKPRLNKEYLNSLGENGIAYSKDSEDRCFRAHGHTMEELMALREPKPYERIPDIVVWPNCHNQVALLVELANKHDVVIIPFGGGTSVSKGLECARDEKRMIVSLDTSQMNRVLWVDKTNLVACCEAGIIGQDLGRELQKHGLTTGHEPDSYEFSSLGGWVATRASGMKKNKYGNIEDLVVHVRFVTPNGVLEKNNQAPRISCGPDFNQIILGSEGTLGVVTEVIIKVRPIPECREFNSYVFPNFTLGVNFMQEIARKRYQPASIRLIDNAQYQMGKLFKEKLGYVGQVIDSIKMMYVTKYLGIDEEQMCIVIAVFEGEQDEVAVDKSRILRTAQKFQGIAAGSKNGERGYTLTFSIAYIRDMLFNYGVIAESFETSVPWDRCLSLCRNVKSVIAAECKIHGIEFFQTSCRVTQVYDTGACVYFYFAFNVGGISDAVHKYEEIEGIAREEILACGGSISHHHGVGKIRRRWYPQQVSTVGVDLYKAIKKHMDPNNIFACGNLII